MDVLHINAFDNKGGAAIAAYRIHKALDKYRKKFDINSNMRVIESKTQDKTVFGGHPKRSSRIWMKLLPYLNRSTRFGYETSNPIIHSSALISSGLGRELEIRFKNNSAEIINLHWIGDITISIKEISRIKQPLVWTLLDQWAFSGAEHYQNVLDLSPSDENFRFINGYLRNNRPKYEKGKDINRVVWSEKKRLFKSKINIICPSKWLADCAKKSILMKNWPIEIIPIPIDLEKYSPIDKHLARKILNLPCKKTLILFGAIGGTKDLRKGCDLLFKALKILHEKSRDSLAISEIELLIFGGADDSQTDLNFFKVHNFGHLNDDISLRLIYSAADLMVVPSRLEGFGQTGLESHACGTPVAAFNFGGLIDIVDNYNTGILSKPFDADSLANKIEWALKDKKRLLEMGIKARKRAEELWSEERVAGLYVDFYKKILSNNKKFSFSKDT